MYTEVDTVQLHRKIFIIGKFVFKYLEKGQYMFRLLLNCSEIQICIDRWIDRQMIDKYIYTKIYMKIYIFATSGQSLKVDCKFD